MSVTVLCGTWTDKYGNKHEGCGAALRWPTEDEKKISGSKKPVNPDGSPHRHADRSSNAQAPQQPAPSAPSTPVHNGNSRPGYYADIIELKECDNVNDANEALKIDDMELLAIKEKTIEVKLTSGQPSVTQTALYVFGKRRKK